MRSFSDPARKISARSLAPTRKISASSSLDHARRRTLTNGILRAKEKAYHRSMLSKRNMKSRRSNKPFPCFHDARSQRPTFKPPQRKPPAYKRQNEMMPNVLHEFFGQKRKPMHRRCRQHRTKAASVKQTTTPTTDLSGKM